MRTSSAITRLYLNILRRAVWDARGIGIVPSDGSRERIISSARLWLTQESEGLREACAAVDGSEVGLDGDTIVRLHCDYLAFIKLNRGRFGK